MPSSHSGVLLVAKPAGVTSHDVVERVRRLPVARGAKVGHAGTLDPFATGLLVVLVGQATRFQRFFTSLPKTYETVARLGAVSDTGDPTGVIEETGMRAGEDAVRAAADRLVGEIDQRVPLTSAVKVGGERLYRKARRGEKFETPVRRVRIARLDVARFDELEQRLELAVECSSGTYVRQLVADLGEATGAGAYCVALERTAIGPFRLAAADEERVVPLVEALSFLPERALDTDEERLARTGRAVENGVENGLENDLGAGAPNVRLTAHGELVAVAERRDGKLKPVTVIPA
jgi:tRNA pseudouridine55 synthase